RGRARLRASARCCAYARAAHASEASLGLLGPSAQADATSVGLMRRLTSLPIPTSWGPSSGVRAAAAARRSGLMRDRRRAAPKPIAEIFPAKSIVGAARSRDRNFAPSLSHPFDHRLPEAGARHLRRALHHPGEVVRDNLVADCLFQARRDEIRGFLP